MESLRLCGHDSKSRINKPQPTFPTIARRHAVVALATHARRPRRWAYFMSAKLLKHQTVMAEGHTVLGSASTAEANQSIEDTLFSLLKAAAPFRGYQPTAWLNGGFHQWNRDGRKQPVQVL